MNRICRGKYIIERSLGAGTYGRIFKVRDRKGDVYAVKKYKSVYSYDNGFEPSALRELDILSRMHHPNIVNTRRIYLSSKCDICLVLEYADMDLATFIQQNITKPDYNPLKIFAEIACGIAELHANHLIHADLKPQNCLMVETPRVDGINPSDTNRDQRRIISNNPPPAIWQAKVADLDCIISTRNIEYPNSGITTLFWRAPEIYDNKPFSNKIDIWALGIILYQLYTNRILIVDSNDQDESLTRKLITDRIEKYQRGKIRGKALKTYKQKYFTSRVYGTFDIPKNVLKLIFQMLTINPDKRPNIQQILANPLLQSYRCITKPTRFYSKSPLPPLPDDPGAIQLIMEMRKITVEWMRKITVEWMRDVCVDYHFTPRVFFTAVDIFDRIFTPNKRTMQLDAITCVVIASKILTYHPMDIDDAAYITNGSSREDQIIAKECEICRKLKFRLYRTTIYDIYPDTDLAILENFIIHNRCTGGPRKCFGQP